MKYVYPAIITEEDGRFLVSVPDLKGCRTYGDNLADAMEMARDAISMWICIAEDMNEVIPEPNYDNMNGEGLRTLISVDTIEYRKQTSNKAVKKTLTIPEWLNDMAIRENINFSNVLQNALLEQLRIK